MILVSAALVSVGAIAGVLIKTQLFRAYALGLAGIVVLAFCLLSVTVLAVVRWHTRRKIGPVIRWSIVILISSLVSLFLFTALAFSIERWKVIAVKRYVSRALPVLDRMKAKDGAYPSTLPESILGQPPELLREYGAYYISDGKTFRFTYIGDSGWEDQTVLSSTDRYWHGEE